MRRQYNNRPGVTTVIGGNLGWNKRPLMLWAHRMGREGVPLDKTRDDAANVGTHIHDRIEALIHGLTDPPYPDTFKAEDIERSDRGFVSFQRWYETCGLVFIATEGCGVDEQYQVGFTFDAIAFDPKTGKYVLVDWKSSKGIYADHLIQVVAYMALADRLFKQYGIEINFQSVYILRVDKNTDCYQVAELPVRELKPAWEAFLALRTLEKHRFDLENTAKIAWKTSFGRKEVSLDD